MQFFRVLLVSALILTGCLFNKPAPTPLQIGDLRALNNQVLDLYLACVDSAQVFRPTTPGCEVSTLENKLSSLRADAKLFISSDIKQPHGYEILLRNNLIFFTIALRTENDYTEAERIARQFFEVQKATSGASLDEAVFYWALMMAEHLAFQAEETLSRNERPSFTEERKNEVKLCIQQTAALLVRMPEGPKKTILMAHFDVLQIFLVL